MDDIKQWTGKDCVELKKIETHRDDGQWSGRQLSSTSKRPGRTTDQWMNRKRIRYAHAIRSTIALLLLTINLIVAVELAVCGTSGTFSVLKLNRECWKHTWTEHEYWIITHPVAAPHRLRQCHTVSHHVTASHCDKMSRRRHNGPVVDIRRRGVWR